MKMRRLPDLDLARIAPLPRDQKRRELEQMKIGFPPYSYDPVRRSNPDILNVDLGPLAVLARAPWPAVVAAITSRCRSVAELEANLRVAEGLYVFAVEQEIAGRRQEFYPLAIGVSEKVTFWLSAVIAIAGKPVVPFIDPRRTRKLTDVGRRFAFSVAHQRIRAADLDYADVGLCIIQFANTKTGLRPPKVFMDDGIELFDFETLDAMVRETYEIWHEVLGEREAAARRAGGTGTLI